MGLGWLINRLFQLVGRNFNVIDEEIDEQSSRAESGLITCCNEHYIILCCYFFEYVGASLPHMNVGTRDVVTCITCYARDSRDKELSETFQHSHTSKTPT
jgi:hypothetical protein